MGQTKKVLREIIQVEAARKACRRSIEHLRPLKEMNPHFSVRERIALLHHQQHLDAAAKREQRRVQSAKRKEKKQQRQEEEQLFLI